MDAQVPSLYDWLGGMEALEWLTTRFYEKVLEDELLKGLFEGMAAEHPKHVAMFLAEVLGGPANYSESCGGHARMLSRHFGRQITQEQRQRWVALLLETADEIKLPDDPEFRSAFVAYLEWGSRLAVINSQSDPSAQADSSVPMPKWGWGVPGGPYIPPK
jgi:hemoglobin